MTLPVRTTKEDFIHHYVQLVNSLVNLSVREMDVVVAMIHQGGTCDSKAMRKVRDSMNVTHGYLSSVLARIKRKGGVTLEKAPGVRGGTWKVHPMFVPPSTTEGELTFKFLFQ